jgi:methylmalonyl-CoA/ethylmalonyl-CoA epimerase
MAKLRHIALTVPDPKKAAEFYMRVFGMKKVGETDWANASGVYLSDGTINLALLNYKTDEAAGEWRGRDFFGIHHFGFWVDDVAATRKAMEAAGARYWMGEPAAGGGFYEIKYRDPNGVVVDITANGWVGAVKDAPKPAGNARSHRAPNKKRPRGAALTRD